MTTRISLITGRALPLRGRDIDTDRIMPARFLKAVTFEGLERHVFEDDRRELAGAGRTHPFDEPAYQGARVLLAQAHFGCGSSREHAPQAIARWGIGAVVAESFAEIFFSNALAIGLPCVTAPPDVIEQLMEMAERRPETECSVDIERREVSAASITALVALPDTARDALLSGGWDATGLLLERYEEVERVAARIPYLSRHS